MMLRSMAMMALALSVSGCATGNDPVVFTGSITPVAPTLIADVSPEYAAAYLPQIAGRVIAVRQSSKPDHVSQSILYPNPGYGEGENELKVSIAPPSSGSSYTRAPTQRQIISEIRTALPGFNMQISPSIGQNALGPFGYATGPAAGGGSCIFAWQNAAEISTGSQKGKGFGRLTRSRYAAEIRLRYCHPTMGAGALVGLMNGLRTREISASTIEMLRFAEGSGVTGRSSHDAGMLQPRQMAEPAAIAAKPAADQGSLAVAAMPSGNAPRVLLPRELAGYAGAQEAMPVVIAGATAGGSDTFDAPVIPMPGNVRR